MTRRLLVLALTVGISAAPSAVTLCQLLCADAPSTAAQHSCHSGAAPASVTVSGVPHACGHSNESPDGVAGVPMAPAGFVAVLPAVAWTMPAPSSAAVATGSVEGPPPGPPPRISQLRV